MQENMNQQLLTFIEKSPSCFHAVAAMKEELLQYGFQELYETKEWVLEKGGKYFVTRNGSSMLAFEVAKELTEYSFQITSSHSDSPTFKVKENAQLEVKGKYTQLNTEGYGGMICSSWLDRPLSVAGRVFIKNEQGFQSKLVNVDRDLLLIPNVAIHMNREINSGFKYNLQVDMLPLFAGNKQDDNVFKQVLGDTLGVDSQSILGMDIYLYNRMKASVWGLHDEFISSPKLDDLQCAYTTLQGFLKGRAKNCVNVFACFDNEEVGSETKQGAGSTFLYDSLQRINTALGYTQEAYYCALANSFMLSADNAHAMHPNHPEKTDGKNEVYMNEGIVVKFNANQKYTTDAISKGVVQALCEKAEVPLQYFANRSDAQGGSTLGNISSTKVSIASADIGLAQLAMHSSYETAGNKDSAYMVKLAQQFYRSRIRFVNNDEIYIEEA